MVVHLEEVRDFVEPDPYPDTQLEKMFKGVPITAENKGEAGREPVISGRNFF